MPTTDAKAALDGSMLPMGGAKGAMLALIVELLACALTGAAIRIRGRLVLRRRRQPAAAGPGVPGHRPRRAGGARRLSRPRRGAGRGDARTIPACACRVPAAMRSRRRPSATESRFRPVALADGLSAARGRRATVRPSLGGAPALRRGIASRNGLKSAGGGGDHLVAAQEVGAAGKIADAAAGFADQQRAGGDVP